MSADTRDALAATTWPTVQQAEDALSDHLLSTIDALAHARAVGAVTDLEAVALFLKLNDVCVEWWDDGQECDGCELVISREAAEVAGLRRVEAVDANGDVDVAICGFCVEDGKDPS